MSFFMWEIDEMRYKRHHQHLIPSIPLPLDVSLCMVAWPKYASERNEKKPIRRTCAYLRQHFCYQYPQRVCVCASEKSWLMIRIRLDIQERERTRSSSSSSTAGLKKRRGRRRRRKTRENEREKELRKTHKEKKKNWYVEQLSFYEMHYNDWLCCY